MSEGTSPTSTGPTASPDQYEDTPSGWSQRLKAEFDAARKVHDDWQKTGQEIVDRFLDKRSGKGSLPDLLG